MTIGTYTRDFYILPTLVYHNGDGIYYSLELAWFKWYMGFCWIKKERTMSRYIDYDKLDDNILALNEKGWEITRGEYKRIQSVMFEMIELEIPDNATNGDVIKALFPKAKIYESSKYHNILFAPSCHLDCRNEDWWNAPYKKGEQE